MGRIEKEKLMNEAQIWDERYKNFTPENEKEKRNENSVFYKLPEKIKNALDIGCGTGKDLRNFAKRKIYVTGWDISEVAISIAKIYGRKKRKIYKVRNRRLERTRKENAE